MQSASEGCKEWKIIKQKISLGAAAYTVVYAPNINQKPQVDVSVVNWGNNIPGVVSGTAV